MPWSVVASGLGLGLALIVAIGAQNAHVLRQGMRREHVGTVVAICAVSDAALVVVGTAGLGAVIAASTVLRVTMTLLGAAVLLGYAAMAARRALRHSPSDGLTVGTERPGSVRPGARWGPVALTTLALTWLNPHVYLDTVVLLGSVAAGQGEARWWFAAGAVAGSLTWFTALGLGARLLSPLLARPGAWRVVDAVIATVMLVIAFRLVAGLWSVG
ncbi:amino acid transporter [Cellulomonas bogoriensis 69B4 = DSM 16987]|uniref:Amino acid transporter n=1 Tax=Cellulomonas bogoriensis 69B4 = DSM 16987 TaxID=1386082 RepID=A0A0A0BZF5_9CELL|nr:amino acid transporter [Cellulomonas bogoriensis 69B4 = DSM 16987]